MSTPANDRAEWLAANRYAHDDAIDPSDALVCFKAVHDRHEPLTDREWAYYEAGRRSVLPPGSTEADQ